MMSEPTPPSPNATTASNLTVAAHRFFPDLNSVSPITESDRIVRVETGAGSFAVYAWPADASHERIEFAQQFRREFAANGIDLLPPALPLPAEPNDPVLTLGGQFFTARPWQARVPLGEPRRLASAGEPVDLPLVVPEPALTAVVEAIARLHQALPAPAHPPTAETLPLRRLSSAAGEFWQTYRARLRPVAPRQPEIQRWLRVGERLLPAARHQLAQQPELAEPTPVAGHDRLWPAHVLMQGQQVSGLLGFSDPAWGSPLLDLAQIATRFARWSPETAEDVLGTYISVRPLSPPERRLLPAVAALDVVIQTGRLLDLAYGPNATDRASLLLTTEIELSLASLEAVAASLMPPKPRPKRRWTHRPPHAPRNGAPRRS